MPDVFAIGSVRWFRMLRDGPLKIWAFGTPFFGATDATAESQPLVLLSSDAGNTFTRNIDQAHASRYTNTGAPNPFTYDPVNRRFMWAWFYNPGPDLNYGLAAGDWTQSAYLHFQYFSIDTGLFSADFAPSATINRYMNTWNAATVYAIGDTVTYTGRAYYANVAGSGNIPTGTYPILGGDPQWSRSIWSALTAYTPGQVVTRDDDHYAWICTAGNTNKDPFTNPAYWDYVREGIGCVGLFPTDDARIIVLYTRTTKANGQFDAYNDPQLYAAIYDSATNAITARNILVSTDAPDGTGAGVPYPNITRVGLIGGMSDGNAARVFYRIGNNDPAVTLSISYRAINSDGTLGAITAVPCGDNIGGATGILTARTIYSYNGSNDSPSLRFCYRRGNTIYADALYGIRTTNTHLDEGISATVAPAIMHGSPIDAPVWTAIEAAPAAAMETNNNFFHERHTGPQETVLQPAVYPFPADPQWTLFNAQPFGQALFAHTPTAYDDADILGWIDGDTIRARVREANGTWRRPTSRYKRKLYNGVVNLSILNDPPHIQGAQATTGSNDAGYWLLNPFDRIGGFIGYPVAIYGANSAAIGHG